MHKFLPHSLVFSLFFGVSAAFGAPSFSGINVIVTPKAGGQVAYQGRTDANGQFATGPLARGAYTVEFRAKNGASFKGTDLVLSVRAGKGGVNQSNLSGDKFSSPVAMNVEVPKTAPLTGRITAATAATAQLETATSGNTKVKVMNGKRYVWVRGEIGSQIGGKWVLEEDAKADGKHVTRDSKEMLRKVQDLGSVGSPGGN